MRITFILPLKCAKTVEMDPNVTGAEATNILVEKHYFEPGFFSFVYGGIILPSDHPFKNLEDNSRVVVYIKPMEKIQREEQEKKKKDEYFQRMLYLARRVIETAQLPALYSKPPVWEKLEQLRQVSALLNNNQSNIYQLLIHDINHPSVPGLRPDNLFSEILQFLDYYVEENLPPEDELEAQLEELSNAQRDFYKRYEKSFNDKFELISIIQESQNEDELKKAVNEKLNSEQK